MPAQGTTRRKAAAQARPRTPKHPGQRWWSERSALWRITRLAGVALLGAAIAFVVVLFANSSSGPVGPDRDEAAVTAAQDYLDALKPVAEEAGWVIQHGLKAGVTDIGQSRFDDETLRGMPESWENMLREIQGKLADLDTPAALREANGYFVASMDGYAEVAQMLREAVDEPAYRRRMAARRAAEHGQEVDKVWNRGAWMVQAHLRTLGMEPVVWLPEEGDGSSG